MAEVCFWGKVDQWFPEFPFKLPAQGMEEISCGGYIGNDYVVFCAHLQETLHARTAVFGAGTFIAMREKHNYAVHVCPLLLGTYYVLVNDGLCAICEIAILCFP